MINAVSAIDNNITEENNLKTIDDNQDSLDIEKINTGIETTKNDSKEVTKNNNLNIAKESSSESEKIDPDIRLIDSEIHPGVEKTFIAILPYDATGTATFKISKTTISNKIKVEYGMVMYTYKIPETYNKEKYYYYLIYSGDEKYNAKRANATLTLTPEGGKVNATMTLKNITSKYSDTIPLTVKLNDTATGNVIFKVDGTQIAKAKINNGIASVNYTGKLTPGNRTLTATYIGNYLYEETSINSTLEIRKLNTKINVKNIAAKAGNVTLFTANVTDEFGNVAKNTKVQFRLNGNFIGSNTTNNEGVVNVYYLIPSKLYTQKNNISINTIETKTLLSSSKDATLTLKQLKTKTTVPNISTIPSKTVVITATVVDEFNNYVTKGNVTFVKDNVTLKTVAVSNGFAKFTYTTNYKTANQTNIYAYYVGDWKYGNSTGKGTFKITQLKTTISSTAVDAKPNSQITITATIRDQNLNPATEGEVKFTLAGNVIGTSNVTKGVAKIKYTLNSYSAGNYRIQCDYSGSKVYKSCSNNNTMTVTRYSTNIKGDSINAVVGKDTTITITISDEEKYNVKHGTVEYYINNEYIGSSNVSNGVSKITYNVPSKFDGKILRYYVNYEKNDIYDSNSYTDTITVSHQKTVYVSVNGSDSNLGDELHPFKTLGYAVNHITLFGTIKLGEGTFSASGIVLNNSITIVGSGRDKTIIDGLNNGKTIFNITKRNVVLSIRSVTIKNGKSNNEFSAGAIVSSGKLNVYSSAFVDNTATGLYSGGAIYSNGILNLTHCKFVNNVVTNVNSQGGAIRSYNNITYISNCQFDSNKVTGNNSTGGSVIYSEYSDLIINSTIFTNNTAKGKYVTGGVIRCIYGAMVIDNSTFKQNSIKATDYAVGGTIGSIGCGISVLNTSFNSNNIDAINSAGGCAIYVETAALDIIDSKLNSNKIITKDGYGGVIYGYYSVVTLKSNVITNNIVNTTNNAMGGVIYSNSGNLTVDTTNFTNNQVKSENMALAGAIYSYSNVTISNSNFNKNKVNATNIGGGAIANMGNLTVKKTNFIDNYAYDCGNAITSAPTAYNSINNNYWGSNNPEWSKLLYSISQPNSYYTTKINN